MALGPLASKKNLKLAWRRITAGQNPQYKKYFRELYYAYEVCIDQHLSDLSERIKGGAYRPSSPSRIYIPKPSGLQRPITLLGIEDQIVLQALANIAEEKSRDRRKNVENRVVFSNITSADPKSIFLFEKWVTGYSRFGECAEKALSNGFTWLVNFDIAAFYDTVSHELLYKSIYPRTKDAAFKSTIMSWLSTWSSGNSAWPVGHGIPQGPIASALLGELFLLPIDESMKDQYHYLRYVDDFKVFTESEIAAQEAAIRLEVLCQSRGLIPQSSKFSISKILSPPKKFELMASRMEGEEEIGCELKSEEAIKLFLQSLSPSRDRIANKSKAKFVLYRSPPSIDLLGWVQSLMPHHPEHIDAFLAYFSKFEQQHSIRKPCEDYFHTCPYPYVRAELLHFLIPSMGQKEAKKWAERAIEVSKNGNEPFTEKFSHLRLLCKAEELTGVRYSRFVNFQPSLLQALLVPYIPRAALLEGTVSKRLADRSSPEPGLMLAIRLVEEKLSLSDVKIKCDSLPRQAQNTFLRLTGEGERFIAAEAFGEVMKLRYKVSCNLWRQFLGTHYGQAIQLLNLADPVFDSGRSSWLAHMNSLNELLYRNVQSRINESGLPGKQKLLNEKGGQHTFGSLLKSDKPFALAHPEIATNFQSGNNRRAYLPSSHPSDFRSGVNSKPLQKREQQLIAKGFSTAYAALADLIKKLQKTKDSP